MNKDTIYYLPQTPGFDEDDFDENGNFIDENQEPTYRQHPAIANSDLKYLHSPRKFHLNKLRQLTEEQTDYQSFGTLVDDYLLRTPEEFDKKYILTEDIETPSSPNQKQFLELVLNHEEDLKTVDIAAYYSQCYAKPNEDKALELYNSLKDYIDFYNRAKGKIQYSQDDLFKLQEIEKNCRNHKIINKWLFEYPTKGIAVFKHLQIVDIELWGIKWKGELDEAIVNFDEKIIYNIDVKSTSKPIGSFGWEYKKYRYYRQQVLYAKLLYQWLLNQKIINDDPEWLIKTRVIVVESTPLHEVAVIPVPYEVLYEGEEELQEAAKLIQYYQENGWDTTISYNKNDGLELIEWKEIFDEL